MATDYKEIARENERRYGWDKKSRRIYKQLYSEKTHFIYELIQNAEDSKSQCLELRLYEKGLLVWNDGNRFCEEDVRKICSLYSSNKDLTQIGSFGIGFKAVYNYTDYPEIYSGTERFSIQDLINPECIPKSNMDSKVVELVENGKTVFRLPFKEGLPEEDINQLGKRLRELNMQTLLFLRNLKKVHWSDERKKQNGAYHSTRRSHDIIKNAEEVELTDSLNGNNQTTETFLVFRKEICPPKDVINQLLQQEEYDEDKQRIERSAEKLQPIEVAFKIQDERIIEMDSCVLFAYLPTQMKTNLRFLIQSRYQTTPARDNISINSPWNEWLLKETAEFLPDVLEELKAGGLLTPTFFNVIPLHNDKVPVEYEDISKSLQKAMQDRPFIPTQDDGHTIAGYVLYPHTESLYHLLGDWMGQIRWLDPEIRDTKELGRCFKAMDEAGVKKALFSRVLKWLKKHSTKWFEERPDDWLCSLYLYLNKQESEMNRIKELPLVRLENGSHLCASKSTVFFPPDTSEECEEIAPIMDELPILQPSLLEGNTRNDIENFLKKLGVKSLLPENLIREFILPEYLNSGVKPSPEQNRLHVRYLRHFLSKTSTALNNLKEEIGKIQILLVYRENQRETLCFVAPHNAYLSQAYTGNVDLETYFSGHGNVWYVDDGYLDDNSDPKIWLQFLKSLGVMDTPQFDGLPEVLDRINNHKDIDLAQVLWHLLVKALLSGDPHQAIFHQLQETAWLPDKQGNFRVPAECFAPTSENHMVLGDSVAYLHPDFDISQDSEAARRLARKLGVHLNANMNSVLNYLQTLSPKGVSIEQIKPLYCFLAQKNTCPSEEFKQKPLIFTSNPEPNWWKLDKVFWEDESPVFGNHRGYLKESYADYEAILKPFFIALGVLERAAPLDYVRVIREVTSVELADDAEVCERVKILYGRLWQSLQKGGSLPYSEEWQREWEQTRNEKCWLGKKGDKWGFFSTETLVWNDNSYIAKIFDGTIPFWGLGDNMLDLAKYLEIEGCSQATVIFNPIGEQEEDSGWSVKMRNLHSYIHAFLNSPGLCEAGKKDKTSDVLKTLSVRLVEELETTYKLKTVSLTSPNPHPSFLDVSDQEVTLWLALEEDKNDYPLLIGDALEDYFSIKDLGRFTEHLLTKKIQNVLDHWKRVGLRTELCESRQESGTKDVQGKSQVPVDEKVPESTEENDIKFIVNEGNAENSVSPGHNDDSVPITTESNEPQTYTPLPSIKSNENKVDIPEGPEHRKLKEHLAANPSQLGAGLKLVEIEHIFKSKDRVDILLEDSFGNPVPVEVETSYSISIERDIGVWQAVKYKHLAAVEYGLPCEHVRSILAAPEIPDDVKAKCKELGIEPIEVSHIQ